ncbi:MAG: copper resistance protein CopC [Pseudoclavibacter sp.]|jgi:copper transport protein
MTSRAAVGGRSRRLIGTGLLGAALGLLLGLGAVWLQPAAVASAHAYVVSSSPTDGEELKAMPTAVRVTFDEGVTLPGTPDEATVLDATGQRVDAGRPVLNADRTTLTIPVKPGQSKGTYIASWSVISADTHPVGGSVQFGYGVAASPSAAPADRSPSAALSLLVGVAKGVLYLGLVGGLGLLPAAIVLGAEASERRRALHLTRIGLAVAAGASLLQLVLQYLWNASGAAPQTGVALAGAVGTFARSSFAIAVFARLVLLGLAAGAAGLFVRGWSRGRFRGRGLAGFVAIGLGAVATVVVNGHGGAGQWWQFVSTLLHASAAIAWIGGLVVLGWLLLRGRLTAARLQRMPYWSIYAASGVGVLALSGIVQSLIEVRYPAALFTTEYGVILLIKLGLVAVALGLGLLGHRWTRAELGYARDPADEGRPAPGRTARLRSRVRWEAGIGAAVVIVSGVLSSISPAEAAYSPTATARSEIGPYRVTMEVSPARRGPQTFRVQVVEPNFDSAFPQSVQVQLSQPDGSVQNLKLQFPYRVAGVIHSGRPTPVTFTSAAVNVPQTGTWTATVTVVVSRLEQYTADLPYWVQ